MGKAKKELTDGWLHFLKCINFEQSLSTLDGEAIVFMNEFGILLDNAIKEGEV